MVYAVVSTTCCFICSGDGGADVPDTMIEAPNRLVLLVSGTSCFVFSGYPPKQLERTFDCHWSCKSPFNNSGKSDTIRFDWHNPNSDKCHWSSIILYPARCFGCFYPHNAFPSHDAFAPSIYTFLKHVRESRGAFVRDAITL